MRDKTQIAAVGFRAKTARAIAIALKADGSAPAYLARWDVMLHDPSAPATSQPHHEVMHLPWPAAQSAVQKWERRIEAVAAQALSGLLRELRSGSCEVLGVAIVGSPDRNLERIGNPHIRAHAAEGILFRRVLEVAAIEHKLPWRSFAEKELENIACARLQKSPEEVKAALESIGRAAGKPWRADERAAALVAWLALSYCGRGL